MWHLAAFFEDEGAAIVNARINALNDQVLTIRNNDFFLRDRMDLLWAACMGVTLDDARLESPSLRIPTFPYIRPVNVGLVPAAEPRVSDWTMQPFALKGEEQLGLFATDPAADPGNITGLVGLRLQSRPLPGGNIYKMRGVSTTVPTANVWSTIEGVTYTNDLPRGRYAMVGMEHFSATGQACRAVYNDQTPRPGCVSITGIGDKTDRIFTQGTMGNWGEFDNDRVPNLEVLCNAADTAHEVYLYLIQTSNQVGG